MKFLIRIRPATSRDVPALQELIGESVRALQAQDYSSEQREAALQSVFGVDSQLIDDGTYLLAEARLEGADQHSQPSADNLVGGKPRFAGCGGWSKRKTLYGGDQWTARQDDLLDPKVDAAKIRAFFIHPAWSRRGIGTRILNACESAAHAGGFSRYEMGATLTGVKLFSARGYIPMRKIEISIGEGLTLPIVHMEKRA
jgi:N-acetylglutamate synthase-like GNAT family acetyltransferase